MEETSRKSERDEAFGSNAVRLSPVEWVVALLVAGAILYAVPPVWERAPSATAVAVSPPVGQASLLFIGGA